MIRRAWGAIWLPLILIVASLLVVARPAPRQASAANGQNGYPTGGTIYAEGYNKDQQVVRFRGGLTVADSNSISVTLAAALAATPVEVFQLNGKPTVTVSCRFATSSSNTCTVRVVWLYYTGTGTTYYVTGSSVQQTATATALQDAANPTTLTGAGYFMAPDLYFDGHGATHALIMLTGAPSAGGAVDFWVGSF